LSFVSVFFDLLSCQPFGESAAAAAFGYCVRFGAVTEKEVAGRF